MSKITNPFDEKSNTFSNDINLENWKYNFRNVKRNY